MVGTPWEKGKTKIFVGKKQLAFCWKKKDKTEECKRNWETKRGKVGN